LYQKVFFFKKPLLFLPGPDIRNCCKCKEPQPFSLGRVKPCVYAVRQALRTSAADQGKIPVLEENSFTEVEVEKTDLAFMGTGFWFVRGKAEKAG
jgi:hypothetical protein